MVIGWAKRGKRGKRKQWTYKTQDMPSQAGGRHSTDWRGYTTCLSRSQETPVEAVNKCIKDALNLSNAQNAALRQKCEALENELVEIKEKLGCHRAYIPHTIEDMLQKCKGLEDRLAFQDKWLSDGVYYTNEEHKQEVVNVKHLLEQQLMECQKELEECKKKE